MRQVERRFESKRDAWIVAVMWATVLILLVTAGGMRSAGALSGVGQLGVDLACLAVAGFLLWITYGTAYAVHADRLEIRSGPFRLTVPLAEIVRVEPSWTPLSSPAMSLDRLKVSRAGGRAVWISPEDRAGFLRALSEADPELRVDGETVARA